MKEKIGFQKVGKAESSPDLDEWWHVGRLRAERGAPVEGGNGERK
jgi:hypothetical protein